jgi:hypothetical protein
MQSIRKLGFNCISLKEILVFSIVVSSLTSYTQNYRIGFQTGLGSYSMTDLKSLNNYVIRSTPFNDKVIADFPNYLYYKPEVKFEFNDFRLGATTSFHSTGSRVSLKDYSGEYLFDTKIKSYGISLTGDLIINPGKTRLVNFLLTSETGLLFSFLEMEEKFNLLEQIESDDSYNYSSHNYFVQPGIALDFNLPYVGVQLNLGYLIQFGKNSFVDSEKNYLGVNNNPVKPNWDGFRYGLTIYYRLKKPASS